MVGRVRTAVFGTYEKGIKRNGRREEHLTSYTVISCLLNWQDMLGRGKGENKEYLVLSRNLKDEPLTVYRCPLVYQQREEYYEVMGRQQCLIEQQVARACRRNIMRCERHTSA